MLNFVSVSKAYGPQTILQGASLQLPHRGVIGLIGHNGAGKTTLLRMMSGHESIDAGKIDRPKGTEIGVLEQDVITHDAGSVLATALFGFATLEQMQLRLAQISDQLGSLKSDGPESKALLAEMAHAQETYDRVDGGRLEPEARTLLAGLGFSQAEVDGPFAALSGGWKMRVALARLLLSRPEVLLLDEPTNHLDIDALIWLEEFLRSYPGLVILTSHDRTFLDRSVTHILALEEGSLWLEVGNYTRYETRRAERIEFQLRQQASQMREREKMEAFIARFRAKASKARQAQSRQKQLDKMDEVEVMQIRDTRINLQIPEAPPSPKIMARVQGLHKSFGTKTLFRGFNWELGPGQKVALVGPNGAGKSTLLKMLVGAMAYDSGNIEIGGRVQLGYFAQDQVDQLDEKLTVLQTMEKAYPMLPHKALRTILGGLLFSGDSVYKQVGVLSGGERARVCLALLFMEPRNLLVLDEPTNHLDMEARETVAEALADYNGSAIIVSHDRAFLNTFVNHVIDLHADGVQTYPGTMDDYEWHLKQRHEREIAQLNPPAQAPVKIPVTKTESAIPKPSQTKPAQAPAMDNATLWKRRKSIGADFARAVKAIEANERKVEDLKAALASPAHAADYSKLLTIQADLDAARKADGKLVADWERLIAEGEAMGIDLLAESAK